MQPAHTRLPGSSSLRCPTDTVAPSSQVLCGPWAEETTSQRCTPPIPVLSCSVEVHLGLNLYFMLYWERRDKLGERHRLTSAGSFWPQKKIRKRYSKIRAILLSLGIMYEFTSLPNRGLLGVRSTPRPTEQQLPGTETPVGKSWRR